MVLVKKHLIWLLEPYVDKIRGEIIMFKLELSKPKFLKNTLKAISSIYDDIQLEITKNGIQIRALDQSHIIFMNLCLYETLFDSYQSDTENNKLIVDSGELYNIFKSLTKDDRLTMRTNGNDELVIIFDGEAQKEFTLKTIDMEYETPKPPIYEFNNGVELPFELFKKSINDNDLHSDTVRLSVDIDYFKASSNGNYVTTNIQYLHGENIEDGGSSSYNIEKIKDCLKSEDFSDVIKLFIGDDKPLKMVFDNDESLLEFILAPRIEEVE
jgi:proliferating cell nuclear antigen PCNA